VIKRNAAISINNMLCRRTSKACVSLAFLVVWHAFIPHILLGQMPQIEIFPGFSSSPFATGSEKNVVHLVSPTSHINYSFDEAMKVPAASLARGITDLLYTRELVLKAKQGATVYVWLTKSKVMVDIRNVDQILEEIDKRLTQYRQAAEQRGREKLSRTYDMFIDFKVVPTLIDDRSGDFWWWNGFSYQPIAIVENKFAIKDYQNTEITLIGTITSGDSIAVEVWVTRPHLPIFGEIPPEDLLGKVTWRARSGEQYRYADVYASRAEFFLASGDYAWALEDATSALEINKKQRAAYLVRSQIYSSCPIDSLRDGSKALNDADTYCKLANDPESKSNCSSIHGSALAELGRFDEAIAEIEYATHDAPEEAKPMLLLRLEKFKKRTPHRMQE